MTSTEFVVCPEPVTCHRCHGEQDTGWPVALIAQWQGRGWYACVGCVRDVEGVAR